MSKKKGNTSTIYKDIFMKKKSSFFLLLAVIIAGVVAESVNPYIYGKIIDSITNKELRTLKNYLFIFFVIMLAVQCLSILESLIGQKVTTLLENEIKEKLFSKIAVLKYCELDKYQSGELLNRLEFDAEAIIDYYIDLITSSVMIVFNLSISLFFIIRISGTLTIVSILMLPTSYFINFLFRNRIRMMQILMKKFNDKYYSFIEETLSNIRGIKIFQAEKRYLKKYKGYLEENYNIIMRNAKLTSLVSFLRGFVNNLFDILILFISALIIFGGKMTIGSMVAFNTYLQKLVEAITKIMDINMNKQNINVNYERIYTLLHEAEEEDENSEMEPLDGIFKVKFQNVSFRYTDRLVIDSLNFNIDGPGLYSIVGKNGSGKSTILKLLEMQYRCAEGEIQINGQRIENYGVYQIRSQTAYMAKEPFFINDTIANNLRIGCPDADKNQMKKVCRRVGIYEDILGFENQFATSLGEGGIRLSSGQKQRLGLARILLMDKPLILLDEVTSDLDGEIDQEIGNVIKEMAQTSIVINISHKPELVKISDWIMVIEDGNIVGTGIHSQLSEGCGQYKELFNQIQPE